MTQLAIIYLLFLLPLAITDISDVGDLGKKEIVKIVHEASRGKDSKNRGIRILGRSFMRRRSSFQFRGGDKGSGPFEMASNVSVPVQLGRPMTISCNGNKALGLCVFKPPFAKRAKIFSPTTQLEDGRIRMSERAAGDPRICEIRVSKLESKDLGSWRCVVKCKCNMFKGKHFNVLETPRVLGSPENAPENENAPEPEPEPEVYMQTNNSYHGGVVMKVKGQIMKVIGFKIPEQGTGGAKSTLKMKILRGASVSEDEIKLGETTFKRHMISPKMPSHPSVNVDRGRLPRPGLYATRTVTNTNDRHNSQPGWYNESAELGWKKMKNSKGILAFAYQGLNDCIFTGIKMVGDTFVPAGENSTIISTVDEANTADTINGLVQWAWPGFRGANWRPYKLHMNDKMDSRAKFKFSRTETKHNKKTYTYLEEYIHFDEMEKLIEEE